jgi:CheY-like chemotaxis protein
MVSTQQPHVHTVLLVEDDSGTRDAMHELLVAHQYMVVDARDGPQALTLVQREPRPCVIVLDLMMSAMSGDEFRRAQLADPGVCDIPVILVSGVRDLAERAAALGVAAYLPKPFNVEGLARVIAQQCVAAVAVA